MPIVDREFVLTHVFKNVSSKKDGEDHCSPAEEHFGVPWKISSKRSGGHLALYLYCEPEKKDKEWSIDTECDGKLSAVNAAKVAKQCEHVFQSTTDVECGWHQFIKWEDMMKDYVVDDTLKVEIRVKIKKMVGINLMSFDESTKEFSDVVIVVENQKFYVSKLFLARHSSYFKALLMGNFKESGKSEVTLQNITPSDFQNFLELLHGEYPIDESTVDGIVYLAEMYDAKLAIRKCEQFLIENSEKSLKEKLQLAHRYNFKNLRNFCLSKITTVAHIRSVLMNDLSKMDPSVAGELMQKSLALSEE